MNLGEIIFNDVMKDFNKKYKEYNTLEKYLNSYTKKELYRLGVRFGLTTSDKKLSEAVVANISTKDKMLNYVVDNIEGIIKSHLLIVKEKDIKFLNKILDNNNTITIKDRNIPLTLIFNLGYTPFIHVYYDKKKDLIIINIQKDIGIIINKILKSKSYIKEHKNILNFEKNIEAMLDVYGIIEEDSLYNIYTKVFEDIDKKVFNKYLMNLNLKEGPLGIVRLNDTNYISILGSDEDEIEVYLNNQTEDYKIYPKEFYTNVANRDYLKSLKSYENLYDYLLKYYDLDLNEEEDIFELIICDYLYQVQESKFKAKEAVIKNLDKYFNINSKQKNEIINYLNRIYYDYPKWRKKGNI